MFFGARGNSVDVRERVPGEAGEMAAVRGHVFEERAKSVDVRGRVLGGARRDGRCFRACSQEAGTTRRRMNFTSQNV